MEKKNTCPEHRLRVLVEKHRSAEQKDNKRKKREAEKQISMNTTPYTCGILTLSDKGARGEREDTSGPMLQNILTEQGFNVEAYQLLPDQQPLIEAILIKWVDEKKIDLIVTTGGTGVSRMIRHRRPPARSLT